MLISSEAYLILALEGLSADEKGESLQWREKG
jgi:hypothetical protein